MVPWFPEVIGTTLFVVAMYFDKLPQSKPLTVVILVVIAYAAFKWFSILLSGISQSNLRRNIETFSVFFKRTPEDGDDGSHEDQDASVAEARENLAVKIINSVFCAILVEAALVSMALLYLRTSAADPGAGRWLLLYLVAVTKCGDIGGYLGGTASAALMKGGNHKMFPGISPKKSWEGTITGLVFSVCISLGLGIWLAGSLGFSSKFLVLAGILLYVGGVMGDLAESVVKRIAGTKDSGALVPGMGGVLDVLDSLLVNAPAFLVCVSLGWI